MFDSDSLPGLMSREEMLRVLQENEYGIIPVKPDYLEFITEKNPISDFCAGKAVLTRHVAVIRVKEQEFRFPFVSVVPNSSMIPSETGKYPFFVHISFTDAVQDIYMPTEEIIDRGFAILSFFYEDVTSDEGDFTNRLAALFYNSVMHTSATNATSETSVARTSTDPGKIALWAWAAMRVMDYAMTIETLDKERACVCGHSRLGKTALLCGAFDERFMFVFSNNSGCSGAALSRGKEGETIEKICGMFPFWFCEKYKEYANKEDSMPFDQHFLLASIYPRNAYVASAKKDTWADPVAEYQCLRLTQELLGMKAVPKETPNDAFYNYNGPFGYHVRDGEHYFSRYDWNMYMNYVLENS